MLAQTEPCLHVLISDGHPRSLLNEWNTEHVRLPRNHGDIGSTPRLIGAYHVIDLGIDAVAFLDADNWYDHNRNGDLLVAMDKENADFVLSSRTHCQLDGSTMGACPLTNPEQFIDTNAMLFGPSAFHLLHH